MKGGVNINSDGGLHNRDDKDNNQLKPLRDGVFKESNMMQHLQSKMISHQMAWMYENILNKQKGK